jgi:hypothetical protein
LVEKGTLYWGLGTGDTFLKPYRDVAMLRLYMYFITTQSAVAIALHFVSSYIEIANNEHYPGNGCFVVYSLPTQRIPNLTNRLGASLSLREKAPRTQRKKKEDR